MRRFLHSSVLLVLAAWLAVPASQAQPKELPLGSALPSTDLTVQVVDGSSTTIGALVGARGTVFLFWSNQCPWTDKYQDRVVELIRTYKPSGISFVIINANDPAAFPKETAAEGAKKGLPMPYVIDPGSVFAQSVGASRTPHVFAFDANKVLVYVGSIDDSPGDPGNVKQSYLRDVLEALKSGAAVAVDPTKAFGCTLKFSN